MISKSIYLDNASTTPTDPVVLKAMMPYFSTNYGNPSSLHKLGRITKSAIEQSRKEIAEYVGSEPREIYFTSGGTEADNFAIFGIARANKEKGMHIIVSCIEHKAILDSAKRLEYEGFEVTYLDVDKKGIVSHLIVSLYKEYPAVVRPKIAEYEKSFSSSNPFFDYAKVESFFVFEGEKVIGHIAAIADERFLNIGFVGFFECKNIEECAELLFNESRIFLKKVGKTICRGPINMTVWQNFRVSYPEGNTPFFLEPFTRDYYRNLFLNSGFVVNHKNITTTESINETQIIEYKTLYEQSLARGYSYHLLTEETAAKDISDIFFLTSSIFEQSYSFYNISEKEFLYFTEEYINLLRTHYIFILKNENMKPIGFFFAAPDIFNLEAKRVVMKTMGLLSKYQGVGLGKAMTYFVYSLAKKDGFKELIFSTMSTDNKRIKLLTGPNLSSYRTYEVYEKKI